MATLIQILDLLALQGRIEAAQLSSTLNMSRPMIEAMLEQLKLMGKVTCIQEESGKCFYSGSCKNCYRKKSEVCLRTWWTLRKLP